MNTITDPLPGNNPPDAGEAAAIETHSGPPPAPTDEPAETLSPPQRVAIEKLAAGVNLTEAATAAGVSRMTVYRWLKSDADFLAAYNAWQRNALATARGRLLALTEAAVTTVSNAVTSGDAKTALTVLKALGALEQPKPGSTDPNYIRRQQEIDASEERYRVKNMIGMGIDGRRSSDFL